ncbi:hypothetical protein FRC03_004917 [Tulasnella sp. 419]|nr:hypothetical protein FRC03_004917 [Tulasnella sp. 419]
MQLYPFFTKIQSLDDWSLRFHYSSLVHYLNYACHLCCTFLIQEELKRAQIDVCIPHDVFCINSLRPIKRQTKLGISSILSSTQVLGFERDINWSGHFPRTLMLLALIPFVFINSDRAPRKCSFLRHPFCQ